LLRTRRKLLRHADVFQGSKGIKPTSIYFFDHLIFFLLERFLFGFGPQGCFILASRKEAPGKERNFDVNAAAP